MSMSIAVTDALSNGLGMTPPMGWNAWNKFKCDVSADLIKQQTDKFVELGLLDYGYQYINLDDCWQSTQRDEDGFIQADPAKFPDGIQDLADYVHNKDEKMKIGIYSSAGTMTCAGRAGSLGYETQDA